MAKRKARMSKEARKLKNELKREYAAAKRKPYVRHARYSKRKMKSIS